MYIWYSCMSMSTREFYESWKQELIDDTKFTKAEQTLTKIPDDDVLVLKNEDTLVAFAWSGKRSKHDWNYRFRDKKQMDKYISDYFCKLEDMARLKIERKEQKKKEKLENSQQAQTTLTNRDEPEEEEVVQKADCTDVIIEKCVIL